MKFYRLTQVRAGDGVYVDTYASRLEAKCVFDSLLRAFGATAVNNSCTFVKDHKLNSESVKFYRWCGVRYVRPDIGFLIKVEEVV